MCSCGWDATLGAQLWLGCDSAATASRHMVVGILHEAVHAVASQAPPDRSAAATCQALSHPSSKESGCGCCRMWLATYARSAGDICAFSKDCYRSAQNNHSPRAPSSTNVYCSRMFCADLWQAVFIPMTVAVTVLACASAGTTSGLHQRVCAGCRPLRATASSARLYHTMTGAATVPS